ncbi:MAG TPA: hypothetical protein VF318_04850, partial [Dehalococcoidales bacterium]
MFGGGGFRPGGPGGPGGAGRLRSAQDFDDENELGKIYDGRVVKRLPKYMAWVKKPLVIGATGTVLRTIASLAMPYL